MKKQMVALVALAGFLTFAGGCAKQETVKKEEPIAPSATVAKAPAPAPAPTANTSQDSSRVKPEAVQPDAAAAEKAAKAEQAANAAAASQQAAAAQAAELKAGLEKVYFDFDSASLSKEARERLTKDAELIKKDSAVKVQIQGNCDERGSDDYNLALGEKRAQAAKKYLTSLGIPAERLSVISYGKEKPVDAGHDEAAWAKNRRDELVAR